MTSATEGLGVIRLRGADRLSFLQGQLTQDIATLKPDHPILAGWTTAKGRLRCVCWLADWQDSCWLIMPASLVEAISRQLTMYVLRADVQIDLPDMPLAAAHYSAVADRSALKVNSDKNSISTCLKIDNYLAIVLTAIPEVVLLLGAASPEGAAALNWTDWRHRNLLAGLPSIWPETADSFVPQMLNMDLLGGISFSKGCYVGQEIVARTQNLGRIKRRMYLFNAEVSTGIHPGSVVYSEGTKAGEVVDAVSHAGGTDLLAVIHIEKLTRHLSLDAEGNVQLERRELPYPVPEQVD
jgi:folate-binding protein YgfZ